MALHTGRGRVRVLFALLSLVALAGCPTKTTTLPTWSNSSVDYGQGSLDLYVRYRWVALQDPAGAVVQTPEGGKASVRVFNCGKPIRAAKQLIREKLRDRLVGSQFDDRGARVFLFRWRAQDETMSTAVQAHGPLLIAISSSTIPMEDLARMAARARLGLPVPSIPGCLPFCLEGVACKPLSSEDGR